MNNIADLYKPGYILIADSWENDGDYRDTNWMWFESEQNARSIAAFLAELADNGCTNRCEDVSEKASDIAMKYVDTFKQLYDEENMNWSNKEQVWYFASDCFVYELIGFSEWCGIRAVDALSIVHVKSAEYEELDGVY